MSSRRWNRSVIGMLYSPQITPGMDRPEALAALNAPTAVPCCVN